MRLSALLFTALAFSGCVQSVPAGPTAGPWRFSGTVSTLDQANAIPIPGAELRIVDGGEPNATVATDAAGHYLFPALPGGRYTLAIAAPGYVTVTPIVDLYRDMDVNFALKAE